MTNALVHTVTVVGANGSRSQERMPCARVLRDCLHSPRPDHTAQRNDGVEKATSASLTGTGAAAAVYVGTLSHDTPRVMTGYIDDLRITKYARYTATFTVPDQAFPNG